MGAFKQFFMSQINQLKHLHSWQPKILSPIALVAKLDALTAYIAENLRRENMQEVGALIMRHFQERLGLRSLIEHSLLDVFSSCLHHRKSVMEVDTFVRIVIGFYDSTDVLFLEFVKSQLLVLSGPLSVEQCDEVTRKIFGSEQQQVGHVVMSTIRGEVGNCASEKFPVVDPGYFVYISVWVFHHQRMEMDLTASLHGFEDTLRNSALQSDHQPHLIDEYIDSIISLKHARQMELDKHQETHPHRSVESLKLEQVVQSVLADACMQIAGNSSANTLAAADSFMQAVLNNQKVGDANDFEECLKARNELLRAVEQDSNVETKLEHFCRKIALSVHKDRSYF
jgi:hypothetical protein